jgi:hypothetical protein
MESAVVPWAVILHGCDSKAATQSQLLAYCVMRYLDEFFGKMIISWNIHETLS